MKGHVLPALLVLLFLALLAATGAKMCISPAPVDEEERYALDYGQIRELDWRGLDAGELDLYLGYSDAACVGYFLEGLTQEERAEIQEKSALLNQPVVTSELENSEEDRLNYRLANSKEQVFLDYCREAYAEAKGTASVSEWKFKDGTGCVFYISSDDRSVIWKYEVKGFSDCRYMESDYVSVNQRLSTQIEKGMIKVTETCVKGADGGISFPTGENYVYLHPRVDSVQAVATSVRGYEVNFKSADGSINETAYQPSRIAVDNDDGAIGYMLNISFKDFSQHVTGFHTDEETVFVYKYNTTKQAMTYLRQVVSTVNGFPEIVYLTKQQAIDNATKGVDYHKWTTEDTYTGQSMSAKKIIKGVLTAKYDGYFKSGVIYDSSKPTSYYADKMTGGKTKKATVYRPFGDDVLSDQESTFSLQFAPQKLGVDMYDEDGRVVISSDVAEYNIQLFENTYTINYKGNGATGGSTSPQAKILYTKPINLRANGFTRTGHTFREWNTKADGTGMFYDAGTSVSKLTPKHEGTVTLYAIWDPNHSSLKVNPNGGTWNGKTTVQSFTGGYGETKSIPLPKRSGYTFTGWKKSSGFHGSMTSLTQKATYTFGAKEGSSDTLTAQWKANTFTLTVKPNGGTWNNTSSNSSFTLSCQGTKTIGNPKRTGYTFTGWSLSGAGSSLDGKTFTMGHANAALTANWKINQYTLTVKPGGGTWNGKTSDSSFTLNYKGTKAIEDPKRTGYTFTGWSLSGAGSSLEGKTFAMGHANATLTASWKINRYQVTVKPNGGIWGGTSTDSSFMLQYQEKKSIPDPTRKGYTFTRWSVSGAGSSLTGGVFTMGHADAAVAAQWRANTYSIAFDGNGETEGEMAPLAATVDSPIQLPQNLYKRTLPQGDSLFLGWSKDPASREAEYTDQQTFTENLAYEQDAVVTLYAIWDDCPVITAPDRYFSRQWAIEGKITEEELLRTVSASDREDVTLPPKTSAQLEAEGETPSVSLWGFDPDVYQNPDIPEKTSVTYRAVDSAGNTVYKEAIIHLVDTAPIAATEKQYLRYINPKYYGKPYEEGGLHPDSVWRTDPAHRAALQRAMDNLGNNTPEYVFTYTPEEVKEAQRYIEEHGFSDTREQGALQGFYNRFMQ